MINKKKTSPKLATIAAKTLKNSSSSKIQKTLAWWVLSQASSTKQTWKDMEKIASDVLKSDKYNKKTKSFAASLVSQSNKKR